MLLAGRSHIPTPTGSIPNAYNGYLRIPDLQWWSFPLFLQIKKFHNNQMFICIKIYYCSVALAILLLNKPSNEAEYIKIVH